ncbi:hypothetical protein [Rhizobium sp. RM]|nr:hypothetical protein [Rhizobium sp. RM]NWJ26055.1 hypothetical protein [Rhizobium sp. RM]
MAAETFSRWLVDKGPLVFYLETIGLLFSATLNWHPDHGIEINPEIFHD